MIIDQYFLLFLFQVQKCAERVISSTFRLYHITAKLKTNFYG